MRLFSPHRGQVHLLRIVLLLGSDTQPSTPCQVEDVTSTPSLVNKRGRALIFHQIGPPSNTPTRGSLSSAHNLENQMDMEPNPGPQLVAPTRDTAPTTPEDLAAATFSDNVDPNLIALVRLFQTLISSLTEKIQSIDVKVNESNAAQKRNTQAVDP
jgi:hypothetical protein